MKYALLIALVFICLSAYPYNERNNDVSADTIHNESKAKVFIGGYIDTYCGYSINKVDNNNIPFFVSADHHNEVSINLAYIDLNYEGKNVRVRIMPGFGTYMQANYLSEPAGLNHLVQGYAGFRIFPKKISGWMPVCWALRLPMKAL